MGRQACVQVGRNDAQAPEHLRNALGILEDGGRSDFFLQSTRSSYVRKARKKVDL